MIYKYLIIIMIFPLCLISCEKIHTTTTVSGTITDFVTGKPLADVSCSLILNGRYGYGSSDYKYSDSLGHYSVSASGEYIFEGYLYTEKKGYYPSGAGLLIDEHNTKNIKMEPLDSWITFKIKNQLNIGDTLWTKFWNKDKIPRYFSSKSDPLLIPFGAEFVEAHDVIGDQYVYITWDYKGKKYAPVTGHLDSVFVPRHDSVIYYITM